MSTEAVVWAQLEQAEATIRHAKEAVRQMMGFHDEKAEARILAKLDDLGRRIDELLAENARLTAALAQAEALIAEMTSTLDRAREQHEAAEARAARYEAVFQEAKVWRERVRPFHEGLAGMFVVEDERDLVAAVDALADAPGDGEER